jgi:hypothetical protein
LVWCRTVELGVDAGAGNAAAMAARHLDGANPAGANPTSAKDMATVVQTTRV